MNRKYTLQISMEEMKEYGEFFRSMRKSIGLNLEKMSQLIGTHRTSLSRWEKGSVIPNEDIDEIVQRIREVVKAAKVS
jgi:transcriptional regulator with XRE-family HTH domain